MLQGELVQVLVAHAARAQRFGVNGNIAHNYGQALEICDRINLLQQGEITLDKVSKDTSVAELNDIVVAEYRQAMQERRRSA